MKPFDYAAFGSAAPALETNTRRLNHAASSGLRPPPRISVAEWAAKHRRFPDDSAYPGRWRHETAPYLVEMMEALSEFDPCEELDCMKCSQSGGTAAIENWLGSIGDVAPGPAMYVQATFRAALDWAAEKFWPMVEATPRLDPSRNGLVNPQSGGDPNRSTKFKVNFRRGGFLLLAGANSAASLRQRTVRYAVEDDLDQHPDDLDGQGSPESMIDSRLKVYRRKGLSKRAKISTPTIKGASKIAAAVETSDKRRFYLKCPGCSGRFDPVWSDIIWPEGRPQDAYLTAPCCGSVIEHWQKGDLSLSDGWLSTEIEGESAPRHLSETDFKAWRARMPLSRKRGFVITGLISAFQTWADMALAFKAAQGDLNKLRAWTNLDLGEPFELKGSTPDYDKLKGLKEQHWGRAQPPVGPLAATMGVDVQGDGLYYEKVGWGENAESWSLDAGFLPGHTDVPGEGAWTQLEQVARAPVTYPGGRTYPLDWICVDAGYHTAASEAFCKAHPNRLAVFGRAGWTLPVLGRGENLRYEQQGKKTGQASKKSQDKAYIVGTYGVKLAFYGYLRSTIAACAEELANQSAVHARGRCHFSRDAPDDWFEQITAETIQVTTVNGYPRREWKPLPGRQNHWLDCRVYNHAAAERLLLETLTENQWAALRTERYGPADPVQGDLLSSLDALGSSIAPPASQATHAVREETPDPAAVPAREGWIDAGEDWI